jgi:hypothetical protein
MTVTEWVHVELPGKHEAMRTRRGVCLFVDVEVLELVIEHMTSSGKRSQSKPAVDCAMTMDGDKEEASNRPKDTRSS